MYSARSPTSRNNSATRASRSSLLPMPCTSIGSLTISYMFMRGFKDENGSWNIICNSRRIGRIPVMESCAKSTVSPVEVWKMISPSVGSSALITHLAVVDFPQPLSPTRLSVSPELIWKLTSSTALTCPTVRRKNPRLIGKCLLRFRTSNTGVSELAYGSGPLAVSVPFSEVISVLLIYDSSARLPATSASVSW